MNKQTNRHTDKQAEGKTETDREGMDVNAASLEWSSSPSFYLISVAIIFFSILFFLPFPLFLIPASRAKQSFARTCFLLQEHDVHSKKMMSSARAGFLLHEHNFFCKNMISSWKNIFRNLVFLVAWARLYSSLCLSVCPSVCLSVRNHFTFFCFFVLLNDF